MNDLLKKLQSMGLKVEKLNPTLTDLKAHPNLKKALNGYWIERNAGRVFVREKIVPYGNKYGQVIINKNRDHNDFSEFWDNGSFAKSPLSDFLFIDTETSGLSLGSGTLIFLGLRRTDWPSRPPARSLCAAQFI